MPPSPNSQNIESYANTLEVHLSNLHTRLVATLDALDEITRNHEMELIGLHDQTRQLRAKCQIFKARAKEAEAERDELKAAVNKLVEKGGRIHYTFGGREKSVYSRSYSFFFKNLYFVSS